ncbi:MAG: hypothetical protein ABIH85_02325 [Candidatus Omnitrophota bacterium]
MDKKFDNFKRAFSPPVGSCSAQCACGRFFYNPDGGWDFEEGELERLEADPEATALEYSVGYIEFEGTIYVLDCDCWIERSKKIIQFIDSHASSIVEYLKLEKERKLEEAENSPIF